MILSVLVAVALRLTAPFGEYEITVPEFAERDFPITDFGAKPGEKCTAAFAAAMAACERAGGGRVIVPEGTWYTGQIRFRSNCNLHLAEKAVVDFSDDPDDYPVVHTTWEGVECLNYSPLVFAYEVENIAITGKGLLRPRMSFWRNWFTRPPAHMYATEQLYYWCSTNAPMAARDVTAIKGSNARPHLLQINRCKNVLLDGFHIRESPFWMIHLYHSENCVVRKLDTYAHGHNNDGVDVDMTQNVLIEDCRFDQGDDGIVLKAGRNQDAWRLNRPTQNVVIRNCDLTRSHSLLGIGSELSGGVRNVWMHHCKVAASGNALNIKTNRRRGGVVENIYLDNCTCGDMKCVFNIATDVLFQWAKFPDFETRYTRIANINVSDVVCDVAQYGVRLLGDRHLKPTGIRVSNVRIGHIFNKLTEIENCDDVILNGVCLLPGGDKREYGTGEHLPIDVRIAERSPRHAKTVAFLERADIDSLPLGKYPIDGDNAWVEIREDALRVCAEFADEVDEAFDTLSVSHATGVYERYWIGVCRREHNCGADRYVFIPAGVPFVSRLVYGNPQTVRRIIAKIRKAR